MTDQPTSSFDDDDLPSVAPPRDPKSGRFVEPQPVVEKPAAATEQVAPQHSSYLLAKALEFGISDAASMTPAELDRMVIHLDRQKQALTRVEPTVVAEPEPEIDWGTENGDPNGKKLTEADWPAPVRLAVKAAAKVEKLEKANQALQTKLDQQEQDRATARATRHLNTLLSERPDLFGEKPGQAKSGSIESKRYQAVVNDLNSRLASKTATTLEADVADALALFGPAQPKQPAATKPAAQAAAGRNPPAAPKQPTIADYENAETARPTQRRGTEALSRRQLMIEHLENERRENGHYVPSSVAEDDDDLPG